VRALCDKIIEKENATWAYENSAPAPFISTLVNPCIERGRDLTRGGAKYNNFGAHGAGMSTAADALAAIKKVIFEDKSVKKIDLLDALHANFVGYESLRRILADCPKMGNNDDFVDEIGCFLMDSFARHFFGKKNRRGGIYRAGTGSAMEYINSADVVGATPDGRRAHDVYGCSYAPAIGAKTLGPLSVVQSFTKFDLKRVCNGGPFTIEMHDTVFRNDEGEKKVAMLVKTFIDLGGHQIQINAINRDRLLDALAHPENHKNLIVRVWGWSGYFNELDKKFQDHIISRAEYSV
jgi:formate C-acetyltransferase